MSIRFQCPDCKATLSITSKKAGAKVVCPKCKTPVVVPTPTQEPKLGIPLGQESVPVERYWRAESPPTRGSTTLNTDSGQHSHPTKLTPAIQQAPVSGQPGDTNGQLATQQTHLMVSFFCSNCATKIQVSGSLKGHFVVCSKCRLQTLVPNIVVAENSPSQLPAANTNDSANKLFDIEPDELPKEEPVYRRSSSRKTRRSKSVSPFVKAAIGFVVLALVVVVVWIIARRAAPVSDEEIYQRTVASSTLIVVKMGSGELGGGSGCLIDRDRKLVVTAYHVVGNASKIKVLFPKYRDGKLLTSFAEYEPSEMVDATVWKSDSRKDLAILRLSSVPKDMQVLPLADSSPKTGEEVHTVGGHPAESIGLWVYSKGNVREVQEDKFMLDSGQQIQAWVIRATNPVNPGDSGGALVNKKCELVGVCCAIHKRAELVRAFIDVREVRALLKK